MGILIFIKLNWNTNKEGFNSKKINFKYKIYKWW